MRTFRSEQVIFLSLALMFSVLFPASGETEHPSKTDRGTTSKQAGALKTRSQLLAAINTWIKEHHQTEWTMDELIGRTVAESYSFGKGDNPIGGAVEDFLVHLIQDKPFTRQLELRSNRVESIKFRKFKKRIPVPLHYALTLDILATETDLKDERMNGRGIDHWRIALATALPDEKQSITASPKHKDRYKTDTPQEVLDTVNLAREEIHLANLSRDELIAVIADKIVVIDDFAGPAPSEAISFLECFLSNRNFKTGIRVQGFLPYDYLDATSTDTRFRIASHECLAIDVLEPAFPESKAVLPVAHLIVSHHTPKAVDNPSAD